MTIDPVIKDKQDAWRTGPCQASCEEHQGKLKIVWVSGWGLFRYCDSAIAEDTRRGFLVFDQPETTE